MNKEQIFLKLTFQEKLEEAEYLYNLPAPEERPFDNKYKSREILQALLNHEYFSNPEYTQNEQKIICKAIIKFKLGANFSDTEENSQAESEYKQSLELFQQLEVEKIRPYLTYVQEIYNIFGLLYINRDENQIGLSLLGKSKDLYNYLKLLPEYKITQKESYSNLLQEQNSQKFTYTYSGGIFYQKIESNFTHTLFYLAQAYTKFGQKELAAQYCGETMKRQHSTQTFQIKDFCFVNLKVPQNVEDAKSIFRQANTQYKRALEHFVLNGFVTEHVQIVQDQSKLYKNIIQLEDNIGKIVTILEKRAELLEPIYNELNPKAYIETSQKLLVEIAEIYNDMYTIKFQELFVNNQNKTPKPSKIAEMNKWAKKAIEHYEKISSLLFEDKDMVRDTQFHHSVINAKFNIAKAYSKIFEQEKKDRIEALKQSLNVYKWISNYIQKDVYKNGVIDVNFANELQMCNEMVDLLPSKIDKVAMQQ
ncbi:kif1 binding protein, putative [Ichthyophthirius multifiliis]|uniref:KIF-binding protein n=1 Tax=Ichthyophthirius multifiliis TaxID=5932 RepID=G0QVS0_ICHMU|nr:kif1 binding protein, putative [Ichthyophthirius multifiliis]EGR30687.1 kif1 binding protein, putative [Ichthyophthirius multifiliis]|eukprot:XP_004032274.1 kif1 binding protein, putative [Ichthyophthirius multifiliis]